MTPITLTAQEAAQLKELIDAALSPQSQEREREQEASVA
jgi:hypothetical protein